MKLPASIFNRPGRAFAALLFVLPVTGLHAASMLETMDAEVSSLYAKSKEAILKVHSECAPIFGNMSFGPVRRSGTGFFIDHEGRFVTAATLVENSKSCWVQWRGQRVNARVLGVDPGTNLALLQVDTGEPTPQLDLGDGGELRVGSMVVAIGFPYEQPSEPVVGFVTGLDIKCGTLVFPVNYIRAGCKLRPGQGGGPLFNARGEVVGIVVAAHSDDQCYALPIQAVRKVCTDIVQSGQTQYSWVGLSVTETNGQVLVQEVTSNSPAAQVGVRDNDILLRIGDKCINRSADILNTMFYRRCGERATLTILRDAKTQEVVVVIGRRPVQPLTARAAPTFPAISPNNPAMPQIVPASAESR